MAIVIKTPEEIEILREGGKRLGFILGEVAKMVKPGISTEELNQYAVKLIKEGGRALRSLARPAKPWRSGGEEGDEAAFLNYKPEGAKHPYPAALCVSVNDEVVHGIPRRERILKEGDIVSLDCGLKHRGLYTDHAITLPVGKVNKEIEKLLEVTEKALYVGIEAARAGGHVGDIGYAIEQFVKQNVPSGVEGPHKYGIVRVLSGHGVGKSIHEDPYVPNFGRRGSGEKLKIGMVIAIEPMLNLGSYAVFLDKDGFTYKTRDRSVSAHFEHTVVITKNGPEILTKV